ncbi:MAG TPA: hypothetical protein VF794_04415 [Archangium sp.]|uniref:hypothetical protein n=1 Tax=Archangium sp. TaxID=1872627 RepID=UPI002EDB5FB0
MSKVYVVITNPGSDPDGCLMGEYPNASARKAIRSAPPPWALGPFHPSRAQALLQRFIGSGGAGHIPGTESGPADMTEAVAPSPKKKAAAKKKAASPKKKVTAKKKAPSPKKKAASPKKKTGARTRRG